MLLNIKSIFFINKIFTIIKGGIKLKLIKYNRFIQKEININLLNYKLFTGKYLIYETKDIQKNMIFMMINWEYVNDKRNGKVKEYEDKSTIENEYLNGKK